MHRTLPAHVLPLLLRSSSKCRLQNPLPAQRCSKCAARKLLGPPLLRYERVRMHLEPCDCGPITASTWFGNMHFRKRRRKKRDVYSELFPKRRDGLNLLRPSSFGRCSSSSSSSSTHRYVSAHLQREDVSPLINKTNFQEQTTSNFASSSFSPPPPCQAHCIHHLRI
jgi:hypothetical protein